MANKFFPVSIDIKNKNILVVGAGKVALRKIKKLLDYDCNISVIAKKAEEDAIKKLHMDNKITLRENKEFNVKDLEGIFLVIAATSDENVNNDISNLCKDRNILVNNVSSKDNMNLRFLSIYDADDFQIAISTYGNPKKSKQLKEGIRLFLQDTSLC